ncbi:hypothetical protein KIPB_005155 [Kipferlia bialata]|uniref:Uncharacterized protein n=1 Tax=Kipferlia bialata TaxID=797122 RepID=A0A391NL09_9EUKA|nr:hypothetical protein KIPB_005155 [Kipferlia bialata]|eukprot:g5155.t1
MLSRCKDGMSSAKIGREKRLFIRKWFYCYSLPEFCRLPLRHIAKLCGLSPSMAYDECEYAANDEIISAKTAEIMLEDETERWRQWRQRRRRRRRE